MPIRLVRLACILSVFCFALPAASQSPEALPPIDPVHRAAYDAGLYTQLGLSQSASGSTIALGYVYADPWMIQVGFGPSMRIFGRVNSAQLRARHPLGGWMEVGEGYVHPDAHWFEWRYLAGDFEPDYAIDGRLPLYDAFAMWPETLELELTVTVAQPGPTPTPEPNPPTLAPEVTPEPTPLPSRLEQDFVFRFSAKPHPVRILQPDITITRAGPEVTLTRLAVMPTRTLMEFCFRELDGAPITDAWHLGISEATLGLDIPDDASPFQQRTAEALSTDLFAVRDCKLYSLQQFYDGAPGRELTLTIENVFSLFKPSVEDWRRIQERLAQDGITMTLIFSGENGDELRDIQIPPDYDLDPIFRELGLTKFIEGPWTFTVRTPNRAAPPALGE